HLCSACPLLILLALCLRPVLTPFPYTTLFRSCPAPRTAAASRRAGAQAAAQSLRPARRRTPPAAAWQSAPRPRSRYPPPAIRRMRRCRAPVARPESPPRALPPLGLGSETPPAAQECRTRPAECPRQGR